jgi:predicted DNA-binding transcriptional regulator YafY
LEGPLDLTQQERMALYFSRGLLKPLAGTPFFEAIESALAKIGAGISAPGHTLLHSFDSQIGIGAFGTKDFTRSREVISALTRAIQHHFTVKITHATPQHRNAVEYRLNPYRLHYHQGGLYLIALDHAKDDLRTFAVERIRTVVSPVAVSLHRPSQHWTSCNQLPFNSSTANRNSCASVSLRIRLRISQSGSGTLRRN